MKVLHVCFVDPFRSSRILRQLSAARGDMVCDVLAICSELSEDQQLPGHESRLFCLRHDRVVRSDSVWKKARVRLKVIFGLACWLRCLQADVLHLHGPRRVLWMVYWKLWHRGGLVYDPHDVPYWGRRQDLADLPFWKASLRLLRWFSPVVITVSDGMSQLFGRLLHTSRVHLVSNNTYFTSDTQAIKNQTGRGEGVKLVYFGQVNEDRISVEVLDVVARCPGVTLDLWGYSTTGWDEILRAHLQSQGNTRVRIRGAFRPQELQDILGQYHYALFPFEIKTYNMEYCMPNKLFQALAFGLPVIASDMKEMADFIKQNKVGIVYPRDCWEEMESILLKLRGEGGPYEQMRSNVAACFSRVGDLSVWESNLRQAYQDSISKK